MVALMVVADAMAMNNAAPDPLAKQTLLDFARVSLMPGASTTVTFDPPMWRSRGQYDLLSPFLTLS